MFIIMENFEKLDRKIRDKKVWKQDEVFEAIWNDKIEKFFENYKKFDELFKYYRQNIYNTPYASDSIMFTILAAIYVLDKDISIIELFFLPLGDKD